MEEEGGAKPSPSLEALTVYGGRVNCNCDVGHIILKCQKATPTKSSGKRVQ